MELSKEVHGLLDRIKKLTNAQRTPESDKNFNNSYANMNATSIDSEESEFDPDDVLQLDDIDFSDREKWLYAPEQTESNIIDLNQWLHKDANTFNGSKISSLEMDLGKYDFKKNIDSRTFTRPKKRSTRPSLENITDGPFDRFQLKSQDISERRVLDSSSVQEMPFNNFLSGPLNFKLSEPVMNNSFDKILLTASDNGIDSFVNMSPPSLMNSLCSSTFTTLMDSSYIQNSDHVPNETTICHSNDNTFTAINGDSVPEKITREPSLNETYDKSDISNKLNSTFSKPSPVFDQHNATYQKNNENKSLNTTYLNLSGTNTITKKPRNITNLPSALKNSCPDINRTFQKNTENNFNKTFQKLSDSQPNLYKNVKQTILNQSMEIMHPEVYEAYQSARSGSTDSLDDKSLTSSMSSSSKESGTKIMNMGDLDNLARLQEESLQQVMSTPKPKTNISRFWAADPISPIHRQEEYLSEDSDMSENCVTARSGYSKQSSSSLSSRSGSLTKLSVHNIPDLDVKRLLPGYVGRQHEMIVKPLEMKKKYAVLEKPQPLRILPLPRPVVRSSALPRPSVSNITGIPRPMSRIPGPRLSRPQLVRPTQRPPSKTDWMDGCY